MKLQKQTIDLLKNFHTINPNILVFPGNKITSRTTAKNIYVEATVPDTFESEFGVYSLPEFLGAISLFSEPEITFNDHSIEISQGKSKVNYTLAAKEVLDYPDPDKPFKKPDFDVNFSLTEDNLRSLVKAGNILSATDILISGDCEKIVCSVVDPKNSSANTFSIEVGETEKSFKVYIKLENLKMPMGAYEVGLCSRKIAEFKATSMEYVMYIANEKNTSWE